MIVKSELEENIILGKDLWINFIATDEKRKILKKLMLLYSVQGLKVSTGIFIFYKTFFKKMQIFRCF